MQYTMQYGYAQLLLAMAANASRSTDHAERQRARDHYLAAHEQFVRTLELDPEGQFTIAAASAQVSAMREHLRYVEPPAVTKACAVDLDGRCRSAVDYSPIEISAAARRMLDAYDIYVKYVKSNAVEELREILLARAQLLIQHNRFDEAELDLARVLEDFAVVDPRPVAMLLDVLTVQWLRAGDDPQRVLATSDALEGWVRELEASPVWRQPELEPTRVQLQLVLGGVAWRRALAHRAAGDAEGLSKCAAQFVELYEQYDMHAEAPAMLWHAAECLAAASQGYEELKMLESLLVRHPDSEQVPDAMLRLAELHHALARPEDSAHHYEAFAQGFAKHERADDALENAYLLRLGLGHAEQAQADLHRYERLYRRSDVGRAAGLFWSQHDLLETNSARRTHALEYLKSYGLEGGVDRAMVAEAVIGQIDWRRSCDEPLLHDSCVTIVRRWPQGRRGCRLERGTLVHVHGRDAKLRAAAQARFDRVLALAAKAEPPTDDPRRVAAFRAAWAMAMVYKADEDYEQYLRVELPEDLDFYVDEQLRDSGVASQEREYAEQAKHTQRSRTRLAEFIGAKTRLADDLREQYAKVSETGSAAWMLAAAARTAAIEQLFAGQLFHALIPTTLTGREQTQAYCEFLTARARPIRDRAIAGYRDCLARSTELQYANEFSRMCEEQLQELDTVALGRAFTIEKSPARHELLGEELVTSSRLEPIGVLASPD